MAKRNSKPKKNNIFSRCFTQDSLLKCYQEYVLKHGSSKEINKQYSDRMIELDYLKIK